MTEYQEPIRLRAHHALSYAIGSSGPETELREEEISRYGSAFLEEADSVYQKLHEDPDLRVIIVEGYDSICDLGCGKKESGECGPKNIAMERLLIAICGLIVGEEYAAGELRKRRFFLP